MNCRQHERKEKSKPSSFFGFDSDDRPIPISEYLSSVSCKQKLTDLNTQDV